MPQCRQCRTEFPIYDADRDFYRRLGVPEPHDCPHCRRLRLLCWRNQRTLYARTCDATGKNIISVFAPDSQYTVYDRDYWWSDAWDPTDYGQELDFTRTFAEQFDELLHRVPMVGIFNGKSVNSQFCNHVGEMKNCYLVFASWGVEDTLYGDMLTDCRDCGDILECSKLERCYDCVSCRDCYAVQSSLQAENCLDSAFLFDCRGCSNCIGCTNLRSKEHCIFNVQCTPEQYAAEKARLALETRSGRAAVVARFAELQRQAIHRFALLVKCEQSTGDNLTNAKNCHDCYAAREIEDCAYIINSAAIAKDIYDGYGVGAKHERGYYVFDTGDRSMETIACGIVWGCQNAYYSYNCHGCTEIFGCSGVRNKRYCILNQPYEPEKYFALKEKLIAHLKHTGEWGDFFPPRLSPFGLNETIGSEYGSLTREEATRRGFHWRETLPGTFGPGTLNEVPDGIADVPDTITAAVLSCEHCQRQYKIIEQELAFYRTSGVPVPVVCPQCRYDARRARRNPHQLHHRQCQCVTSGHDHGDHCPRTFATTYSPDRPEKVYCEDCYQKEIY